LTIVFKPSSSTSILYSPGFEGIDDGFELSALDSTLAGYSSKMVYLVKLAVSLIMSLVASAEDPAISMLYKAESGSKSSRSDSWSNLLENTFG
jgi:hypothetical protein